jgi:hypothetical protein
MGISEDHRRYAGGAMAQRSEDDTDEALWLTLAQSWVRLAEHVARGLRTRTAMTGARGTLHLILPSKTSV